MTALRSETFDCQNAAAPFLGVARSARGQRWVEWLDAAGHTVASAIAQRHSLPDLLARVIAARGATAENAAWYLDPTIKTLMPDPSSVQDMDTGVSRLVEAIEAGETIALFGDYDVDGAVSVALLARFLRAHGAAPLIRIPDRLSEGYGPNVPAFDTLIEAGATLIVTLDCGTSGHEAIAHARRRGADVIVIDHHMTGEGLPDATAVINPNRLDDLSGQGDLAAAGVAFLVVAALTRAMKAAGRYDNGGSPPDLLGWLDMVALATVCDVVPLRGLNRAFVAKGLQVMRHRRNAGLRALGDVAGLTAEPTPYHLGFILGPRINAAGRLGEPELGYRLLQTGDDLEAAGIALRMEELNGERKALEDAIIEEASARADRILEARPDAAVIVAAGAGWHKGLIGLAAARLAERYERPAFAITHDGTGISTGSGRSIRGVDIGSAVADGVRAGVLGKGGGHAMAAGFTLAEDRLDAFAAFLEERLGPGVAEARSQRDLRIDAALMPSAATPALLAELDRAGPYGAANPQPRFAFATQRCNYAKVVGENHVRCVLGAGDGARLDAIAFRAAGTPLGDLLLAQGGMPLHVAGHLRRNSWGGTDKAELHIDDAADPRVQPR